MTRSTGKPICVDYYKISIISLYYPKVFVFLHPNKHRNMLDIPQKGHLMNNIYTIIQEYNQLGIGEQIDYAKFYLYSIITHSTAIEGSTVTEIENRLLFDEGIGAQKPLIEQMMNLDLKAAYERSIAYAREHTDYTLELLCSLSALVMKNTGSEYSTMLGKFSVAKGELRLLNVSAGIGGRSYLSYQKVPGRLQEFCQWLNAQRKKLNVADIEAIYDLSFEAHYRLVNIHPWGDGNGRMSRLVMNMIQYEFGVVPSIVKKEKRKQYISSLEQSDEAEDSKKFKAFMFQHHCDNLLKQIEEYKHSMDDESHSAKPGSTMDGTMALRIMDALRVEPSATMDNLSSTLGIARRTLIRYMNRLQEDNKIKRVGGRRYGHWEIINQD